MSLRVGDRVRVPGPRGVLRDGVVKKVGPAGYLAIVAHPDRGPGHETAVYAVTELVSAGQLYLWPLQSRDDR